MYNPVEPTIVHTGNPPLHAGGFQDLDLSSVIGAQRSFAFIGVKSQSFTSTQIVAVRAKDDSYNTWPRQPDPSYSSFGGATCRLYQYQGPLATAGFLSLTDPNGVMQWKAYLNDASCTVKVYGWLDVDGAPFTSVGTFPMDAAWHSFDLSSIVGAQKTLVMLRVGCGLGSYGGDYIAARPGDMSWDAQGYVGYAASTCYVYSRVTDPVRNYVVLTTDSNGVVHLKNNYSRASSFEVDLIAYSIINGAGRVLVHNGNCPTTPTPLDLSPWLGSKKSMAYLTVRGINVNTSATAQAPSGDSEPWFDGNFGIGGVNRASVANYRAAASVVPTDDQGKIDWMSFTHTTYGVQIYLEGFSPGPLLPIAHWPLDDHKDREGTSARDIAEGASGNHDGVVTFGYYSYWLPGGVGGKHFGDLNTYGGETTINNNPQDFRLPGEFSFMIWGACDQYSGWNDTTVLGSCTGSNDGTPANNSLWSFEVVGRKLQMRWWDDVGSAWRYIKTTNVVTSRQGFQHFAVARYEITPGSPGTFGVRFYVDGVMVEDMDNGGVGYTGPVDGSACTMYLGRRYDFRITYQSNLWYDSARFYNGVIDDAAVQAVYDAEVPVVRPDMTSFMPEVQDPEETPDGSIYEAVEIDGASHANEAGSGGDEYHIVETTPGESVIVCVGDYRILETGPLSIKARSGWWTTA